MGGDENSVPPVARADPQRDLTAATKHLCRDIDEGLTEALPLPANGLFGKREQRDPLRDVPRQARDLEPSAVAIELGDRHPPSSQAFAELLDQVLLVTALVRLVDDVVGRPQEIGDDVAVAVLVEQVLLALVLLDELPADDQPIG